VAPQLAQSANIPGGPGDFSGAIAQTNGELAIEQADQDLSTSLPEVDVTSARISDAAGWAGIGAAIGEPASGTYAIGTNLRFYSAPRGNQYFSTLARVGTLFKAAGLGAFFVGTAADYYDAIQTGSFGQANFNAGVGAAGIFTPIFAPIYVIPGSLYFILSNTYPGGQAAYNAAYSEATNATDSSF
jgi:hypothetical protein